MLLTISLNGFEARYVAPEPHTLPIYLIRFRGVLIGCYSKSGLTFFATNIPLKDFFGISFEYLLLQIDKEFALLKI